MPTSPALTDLIAAREHAYRGDTPSPYNSFPELIALRRHGYLQGGSEENTPRDWTAAESAELKHAYRAGHHRALLVELFPGECEEVDRESAEPFASENICDASCFDPIPH